MDNPKTGEQQEMKQEDKDNISTISWRGRCTYPGGQNLGWQQVNSRQLDVVVKKDERRCMSFAACSRSRLHTRVGVTSHRGKSDATLR